MNMTVRNFEVICGKFMVVGICFVEIVHINGVLTCITVTYSSY